MDERAVYAAITGQVIQHLRTGKMSQAVLASRAELSSSALSRFENGQSLPDMYEARRLARVLDLTPGQFHNVVEEALKHAVQVQRKIAPQDDWNGVAAVAIAGLAAIAVAAIHADRKIRKKTPRSG